MRLLESKDPVVVANATGVLRNLTSGSNIPLCKEFEKLGGIRAISGLLERLFQILTEDETGNRYMSRNDSDRLCASMENASAILCNISSLECMRSGNLLVSVVPSLVSAVLEPVAEAACCRLNSRNEDGAPPYSCALYRNCTAVIRNLSCSVDTDTRSLLRRCPGLLASLLTVMHVAGETGLADTKAVENCACAVRNLCFSLWATVEFAESGESVSNRSERVSNRTPKDMIPWETPTKVPETLLWHANAVACFLTLLRRASNPVCTEAAAGALRNLTSKANWRPAEIVRSEVRLQHGLPVLVDLLCVSNSAVVTTVAMALRNLCVERETLEVLGQQAIPVLVSCLSAVPETPRSRSLSSLRSLASSPRNRPQLTSHALAAILALCSTIILGHEKFARFVHG
ncbi:unnamed protein product [Mesocestoides corti]|uniref:Armadillo repeat-containing domain-containing protein n=1 Tax=Mesocestoides corti TaxID=53468 RepID=A0A158QS73_MESCO|nr:unnamed protein product [Mesocestoides corti]